ncbi:hypothetical protein ACFX13_011904 [Malus domestica]
MKEPSIRVRNPNVVNQKSHIQPFNSLPNAPDAVVEVAGEVDHDGLDLGFAVLGQDSVGHVLELVRIPTDQDQIEPRPSQLEGEGLANAVGGSRDEGPRSVLFEILGGSEEIDVDPLEEREGEFEERERADNEEHKNPERLSLEVLE